MKRPGHFRVAVPIVLIAALLYTLPFGHLLHGSERQSRFLDTLSSGDQVALEAQPEGIYVIIAPNADYWRNSSKQRGRFQRGTVTDVHEDFVSIRLVYRFTDDPLAPHGQTRLVHLPVYAISQVITFTDAPH
jgi:hypothetical protein